MSPAEAKMRIFAEWRTWVGHRLVADSQTLTDGNAFYEDIAQSQPDLLLFESDEDKQQLVSRWLAEAGLIK